MRWLGSFLYNELTGQVYPYSWSSRLFAYQYVSINPFFANNFETGTFILSKSKCDGSLKSPAIIALLY